MLSDFAKYVRQYWHDRPDKSTPLNAERMNYIENGIEANANAIDEIAKAVVSNIVNDPNKIASMAAVYALQEKLGTGNLPSDTSDVISAINALNSNLNSKTSLKSYETGSSLKFAFRNSNDEPVLIVNIDNINAIYIKADGWADI